MSKHEDHDNVLVMRPRNSYKEDNLPSNEGVKFRRFHRYENIHAVNKCTFTKCKPSDTAHWRWRKIGKVLYIEIKTEENSYNYYRVESLSRNKMELVPCRIPG